MSKGMHHLGLATHDMEKTLEFYEDVLGFPAVVCEMIEPESGGAIRHAFFGSSLGRDSETLGSVFPRFSNREIWSDEQGFRRPKSISQPG